MKRSVQQAMSGKKEIEVELGDNGAGTHCDDQFMRYAGGGAVAGNPIWCALIRTHVTLNRVGACFGAVEACLVNPVPGQTTPLVFKAFRIMGTRSLLVGQSRLFIKGPQFQRLVCVVCLQVQLEVSLLWERVSQPN